MIRIIRRLLPASMLALLTLAFGSMPPARQQFQFPQKAGAVRFAVIGDMGTGESHQYEIARQMAEYRKNFPFDFVITMGDNIYGGHKPRDFEKKFAEPYQSLLSGGVTFYASLGNHDRAVERAYKAFNMNGADYYTFTKGNIEFFALDSNYMGPEQLEWLKTQLQISKSEWKICFFHHPLYSSAKAHGPSIDLRSLIEPIFIHYGVDVVFSGHEHVYEDIKPQHGIYYFIEGASGQLRYGNLRQSDIMQKGFDTDNSFMLVEVSGNQMYFETISRSGEVVDSGTIPLRGASS